MKIALFYASWEKFGEPWSTPLGVKRELEGRGHEVKCYNLYHDDGMLPKKGIRRYSGDCFNRFSVDYQRGYMPDGLVLMDYGPFDYVGCDKKFFPGVPFVLEAGDTPQSFRMHAQRAHKFHATVTPDWPSVQMFNKMGLNAKWMTHWADHKIFHDGYDIEPIYDVVSTCGGRRDTARITEVLGDRFNNERYFYGEDHPKRLMMGHIVFQCSQHKEVTRRIFEGMACGRMVITDRLPEATRLQELFIDGEDIVYYDGADDAIEKINYYIEHEQEREQIAANGKHKVLTQHTVSHRVDELERVIDEISHDIKRTTP